MGRETGYFHRKPFPRFSPVLLVVPVAGVWEHGARGRIREFLCFQLWYVGLVFLCDGKDTADS